MSLAELAQYSGQEGNESDGDETEPDNPTLIPSISEPPTDPAIDRLKSAAASAETSPAIALSESSPESHANREKTNESDGEFDRSRIGFPACLLEQYDIETPNTRVEGEPSEELRTKIESYLKILKRTGKTAVESFSSSKAYKNPSIYNKLIDKTGIEERGTNFPKDMFDPKLFGEESHYKELAKAQNVLMEQRQKNKSKDDKEEKREKRKKRTKWDQ